jgi:hypothetical protein
MFHYRHVGDGRDADLDAVNLARVSHGLEPHARPTRSRAAAVVTLLLVIAALMVLVT